MDIATEVILEISGVIRQELTAIFIEMEELRVPDVTVIESDITTYNLDLDTVQTIIMDGFGIFDGDVATSISIALYSFQFDAIEDRTLILSRFYHHFRIYIQIEGIDAAIVANIELVMSSDSFVQAISRVFILFDIGQLDVDIGDFAAQLSDGVITTEALAGLLATFTLEIELDVNDIYNYVYDNMEMSPFQKAIANVDFGEFTDLLSSHFKILITSLPIFVETNVQSQLRAHFEDYLAQGHFSAELTESLRLLTFEHSFASLVFSVETLVQFWSQISETFTYAQFQLVNLNATGEFDYSNTFEFYTSDFFATIVEASNAPQDAIDVVITAWDVVSTNLFIDLPFTHIQLIMANFWRNDFTFTSDVDIDMLMNIILKFDTSTSITVQRVEIFIINHLIINNVDITVIVEIKQAIRTQMSAIFVTMEALRLSAIESEIDVSVLETFDLTLGTFQNFIYQAFFDSESDTELNEAILKALVGFDFGSIVNRDEILQQFYLFFGIYTRTESLSISQLADLHYMVSSRSFFDIMVRVYIAHDYYGFEFVDMLLTGMLGLETDGVFDTVTETAMEDVVAGIETEVTFVFNIDEIYVSVYESFQFNIYQHAVLFYFTDLHFTTAEDHATIVNIVLTMGRFETDMSIQRQFRQFLDAHWSMFDETVMTSMMAITWNNEFSSLMFVLETMLQIEQHFSEEFTYEHFRTEHFGTFGLMISLDWELTYEELDFTYYSSFIAASLENYPAVAAAVDTTDVFAVIQMAILVDLKEFQQGAYELITANFAWMDSNEDNFLFTTVRPIAQNMVIFQSTWSKGVFYYVHHIMNALFTAGTFGGYSEVDFEANMYASFAAAFISFTSSDIIPAIGDVDFEFLSGENNLFGGSQASSMMYMYGYFSTHSGFTWNDMTNSEFGAILYFVSGSDFVTVALEDGVTLEQHMSSYTLTFLNTVTGMSEEFMFWFRRMGFSMQYRTNIMFQVRVLNMSYIKSFSKFLETFKVFHQS